MLGVERWTFSIVHSLLNLNRAATARWSDTSFSITRTCHAHPTLSEAIKEAAPAVAGRGIHS
jgi:dihydrolipoamide dehydrogenase